LLSRPPSNTRPVKKESHAINEGRRKKEEGRRKKEEGRRKKEEGRRKKEEGRRKKEEARKEKISILSSVSITYLLSFIFYLL